MEMSNPLRVFFQGIGTLFSYNLGLTSKLASFKDVNVTLGTRTLLLYLYGIWAKHYMKNLEIVMTTFPTFPPNSYTKSLGSSVARMLIRSSLYNKFLSNFDVIHLNDRAHPYTYETVDTKKKSVLTFHWRPSKIDEYTFKKAEAVVAPSISASKAAEEKLGIRPKIIYNGVDTSLFNTQITGSEARKYLGLSMTRRIILWNGRISPVKDLKTLIDAIPIVAKEFPDSLFLVKGRSGSKHILQYAKQHIKRTNIGHNVKMMIGWDFITKMPYYYRSADVCVHTSLIECCSLVLIEAMACGLPIVVTDRIAVYDPVGDAGLHFEPRNSEDLAEKIIRLLENDKLRSKLCMRGLKRISELGLTWRKAAESYRKLYLSIL